MENFDKINVDQICSISVFAKKKCERFIFVPKHKKKFLWITPNIDVKEYFHNLQTYGEINPNFSREEIEKYEDLYIEDNVVYYKPYVIIIMSNDRNFKKEFQRKEELETFLNQPKLTSQINWINL